MADSKLVQHNFYWLLIHHACYTRGPTQKIMEQKPVDFFSSQNFGRKTTVQCLIHIYSVRVKNTIILDENRNINLLDSAEIYRYLNTKQTQIHSNPAVYIYSVLIGALN